MVPTSCQLSQGLREPEQHGEDYPQNGSGNTSFGDLEGPTSSSEGSWEESRQSWTLQSGFLTLPNQQHPFILSGAAPGLLHLHLDTGHCLPQAAGEGPGNRQPRKGEAQRKGGKGGGWLGFWEGTHTEGRHTGTWGERALKFLFLLSL